MPSVQRAAIAVQRMRHMCVAAALTREVRPVAGALSLQAEALQMRRARETLVPLIEKKLDGFVLWFFANKDKLEAQERGEACPHHESLDDCPSKNDPSHACPFTQSKQADTVMSTWTADECSEAEVVVEKTITKAERQLHLLEHALKPYARGERNVFSTPLRLTRDGGLLREKVEQVASFDALLALYQTEMEARYGADPAEWTRDSDPLVLELTTKFLEAVEPDCQID